MMEFKVLVSFFNLFFLYLMNDHLQQNLSKIDRCIYLQKYFQTMDCLPKTQGSDSEKKADEWRYRDMQKYKVGDWEEAHIVFNSRRREFDDIFS